MPVITPNASFAQAIQFNTGFMDINGIRVATLQDITITAGFTLKEIRALGTIKMVVAPKRTEWKPGAKFKAMSVNQGLLGFLWGSSTVDSTGWDFNVVDGQVVLASVIITAYTNDAVSNIMQFQFVNSVFGTGTVGYKMDGAAEFDLEIMSQDLTTVTNYTTLSGYPGQPT